MESTFNYDMIRTLNVANLDLDLTKMEDLMKI